MVGQGAVILLKPWKALVGGVFKLMVDVKELNRQGRKVDEEG